jgi:hypothetical protein|tara:strand:- start:962 stop:1342 length:381 start_codon:yes stop_codon:yes gene_type:complete
MIYSSDLKHLEKALDKDQLEKYYKIKKERLNHFYTGLGVGSFIGLAIILSKINVTSSYCLAGILLIFTTITIYYILPKSDYMVRHLKTEEQKNAWMAINRNFMKKKLVGGISVILLYFCVPIVIKL